MVTLCRCNTNAA